MASDKLEAQYKELDGQIESLMKCTPLPEAEVKVLCDKAREILQVRQSNLYRLQRPAKSLKCPLSKYFQGWL